VFAGMKQSKVAEKTLSDILPGVPKREGEGEETKRQEC